MKGDERIRTAVCFHGANGTISPEIGYRLASLVDGEGCFSIYRGQRKSRGRGIYNRRVSPLYHCAFFVQVRDDDYEFLVRMAGAVGLGRIYRNENRATDSRKNNPRARWAITRVGECVRLTEILDEYPLWSKKAVEFEVWRHAVRRWSGPRVIEEAEWQASYEALRDLKVYKPREEAASA